MIQDLILEKVDTKGEEGKKDGKKNSNRPTYQD